MRVRIAPLPWDFVLRLYRQSEVLRLRSQAHDKDPWACVSFAGMADTFAESLLLENSSLSMQCAYMSAAAESLQSCLTLHNPMDWSLQGSSVYGIFQARVLEWVAIAFANICLSTNQTSPFPCFDVSNNGVKEVSNNHRTLVPKGPQRPVRCFKMRNLRPAPRPC